LGDNLSISIPCFDLLTSRFGFTFDHYLDLTWQVNLDSFTASSGGGECFSLGDDLSIRIPCFDLNGTRFGFKFNYSGELFWEVDLESITLHE